MKSVHKYNFLSPLVQIDIFSSLSLSINGARPTEPTTTASSARVIRSTANAVQATASASIFGAFCRSPGCPCPSCRPYAAARFVRRRRSSSGVAAGTGNSTAAGTGSVSAAGTGEGNDVGREPVQGLRRVGLSRHRTLSRSSSVVTAIPSLNFGSGFSVDSRSEFFQGFGGNSSIGSSQLRTGMSQLMFFGV